MISVPIRSNFTSVERFWNALPISQIPEMKNRNHPNNDKRQNNRRTHAENSDKIFPETPWPPVRWAQRNQP